ncbi:hypothetical protein BDW22DRAFT_372130 [Trametopsis cervina]|nr:hypothetical protein BDW22DRAFT_372130 [Trametopsis cervina]
MAFVCFILLVRRTQAHSVIDISPTHLRFVLLLNPAVTQDNADESAVFGFMCGSMQWMDDEFARHVSLTTRAHVTANGHARLGCLVGRAQSSTSRPMLRCRAFLPARASCDVPSSSPDHTTALSLHSAFPIRLITALPLLRILRCRARAALRADLALPAPRPTYK